MSFITYIYSFNFPSFEAFCNSKSIVLYFDVNAWRFCLSQESNDNLEDASNELILTDEEVVRFQIGEVFAHVPKDEVESRIEQMQGATSQKLEKLEEEKQSVVAQMSELKKILYGKFGESINLEED